MLPGKRGSERGAKGLGLLAMDRRERMPGDRSAPRRGRRGEDCFHRGHATAGGCGGEFTPEHLRERGEGPGIGFLTAHNYHVCRDAVKALADRAGGDVQRKGDLRGGVVWRSGCHWFSGGVCRRLA